MTGRVREVTLLVLLVAVIFETVRRVLGAPFEPGMLVVVVIVGVVVAVGGRNHTSV